MARFSHRSLAKLSEAHEKLQRIAHKAIVEYDFCVICGYRGEIEQNESYSRGKSMLKYPDSAHNKHPALAIDVAPWDKETRSIPWHDTGKFIVLWDYINSVAESEGIKLRKMIPWDSGHIELARSEYT